MAMAMREAAGALIADWRRRNRELGFGAGIAQGYATLGQIGFSDRSGYTAIGTVCNLAARLCAEAQGRPDPGQQPRRSRGRGRSAVGGSRKPGAKGSSPSGRGIQRRA
jgi:hypothetical protein